MWKSVIVFLIVIHFKSSNCNRFKPDELKKRYGEVIHVTALFRHGDRSPMSSYPKDPHKLYPWPDGLSQLMKTGKRRLYNLGKWFNQRYSRLINQIQSHTNITVSSSDTDRSIMSAECFMAGFYPLNKSQYIDKQLHWQPIPIHTIPRKHDNMFTHGKPCPAWARIKKNFYNGKQMKRKYDKYEKTFEYLRKHSGLNYTKDDMILTTFNIEQIYDILFVQESNNLTLPQWTKKVYPKELRTIADSLFYQEFKNSEALRLGSGPLFQSIISNMKAKISGVSTTLFNFYSGHDSTIAYSSIALGCWDNNDPPYGSSLIFELRQKTKHKYVTVLYKNSTTSEPYLMPIKGCKYPCTFKTFVSSTRNIVPKNWETECQVRKISFSFLTNLIGRLLKKNNNF